MYFPISAQQCRECLPWVLLLEITLSGKQTVGILHLIVLPWSSGSYKAVHWPSQTTYNENEERSRVLSLISKKYSKHFFLICEAFHDYYWFNNTDLYHTCTVFIFHWELLLRLALVCEMLSWWLINDLIWCILISVLTKGLYGSLYSALYVYMTGGGCTVQQ